MQQQKRLYDENVGRIIFHEAPMGIAIMDSADGTIRESNEAYAAILGRPRAEVKGRTWMEFTHPEDLATDLRCVKALCETGKAGLYREKRYVTPDGGIRHVRITLSVLPGEGGRPSHLTMVENRGEAAALVSERKNRFLDVYRMQEAFFPALAALSEFRNRETGEHLMRTRAYVRLLLENLPGKQPFSRKGIALISNSAMLHDIGKVGIPDSVLLKPGMLTREEYDVMKTHTLLGKKAIRETGRLTKNDSTFSFAQEIAESHHERWDGGGYPFGLREAEIPLSARIMAIADVYDALRSDRPYKSAFTHCDAMRTIRTEAGSHFDPELVGAFIANEKKVDEISRVEKAKLETMDGGPARFSR